MVRSAVPALRARHCWMPCRELTRMMNARTFCTCISECAVRVCAVMPLRAQQRICGPNSRTRRTPSVTALTLFTCRPSGRLDGTTAKFLEIGGLSLLPISAFSTSKIEDFGSQCVCVAVGLGAVRRHA